MRIQTGKVIGLGYGRYVRSDEVVAVEPVKEGRGPGRRCLVWVRGVADPIVASRSEQAIVQDLISPAETARAKMLAPARAAATKRRVRAAKPAPRRPRRRPPGRR